MSARAAVTVEKIDYKGWPNSYRMSNGEADLVITSDIGPRIIRYGFSGGQNVFKEFADQALRRPVRQANPSAPPAHPGHFGGGFFLIGSEHDAEGGQHHIETSFGIRQILGVRLFKLHGHGGAERRMNRPGITEAPLCENL